MMFTWRNVSKMPCRGLLSIVLRCLDSSSSARRFAFEEVPYGGGEGGGAVDREGTVKRAQTQQ